MILHTVNLSAKLYKHQQLIEKIDGLSGKKSHKPLAFNNPDFIRNSDIFEQFKNSIEELIKNERFKPNENKIRKILKNATKELKNLKSQNIEPQNVRAGDSVKLRLEIENTGGKEADSTSVHAFKDSSQPFDLTEKSDYIGKLEQGESGEAIISLDIDEDAQAKSHIIDIEIRGIDGNEVIVEEKQVKITVNNGQTRKAASPLIGGLIIAGIVLIGLVVFYFLRKR